MTKEDLKSKLKDFSGEQFLRQYFCEPKIKSLPSIVEFQNGDRLEWQPSSQREVEEYIKRHNLQPYIQEPDDNGIVILKLPSLSPKQIKKIKDEFINLYMTKEDLKKEIDNAVYPKGWRKGQRVFNYIDDVYGIARRIKFKKHVDCFYNDDAIDVFLDAAVDIINQGQR